MALFVKGVSGNPTGRPKNPSPTSRKLAQPHRKLAVDTLVAQCAPTEDPRVRLAAALAILDRADGRPRNEAPAVDEDEHDSGPRQTLEQLEAKYAKEGNGVQ